MIAMTASSYLGILKTATPDDHPWIDVEGTEEVGAAFANMAISVAAFVEACQANEAVGYGEALSTLESLVHTFPERDTDGPLDILLAAMAKAFGEAGDE